MSETYCPTCGARRAETNIQIKFDDLLNMNTARRKIKIQRLLWETLCIFLTNEQVVDERLFIRLYGSLSEEKSKNLIAVHVCKLNKFLSLLNCRILWLTQHTRKLPKHEQQRILKYLIELENGVLTCEQNPQT